MLTSCICDFIFIMFYCCIKGYDPLAHHCQTSIYQQPYCMFHNTESCRLKNLSYQQSQKKSLPFMIPSSPGILQDSCSIVYIFTEYLSLSCALSLLEYQNCLFFLFPLGLQSSGLSFGKQGTWSPRYNSLGLISIKNNQFCIRSVSAAQA